MLKIKCILKVWENRSIQELFLIDSKKVAPLTNGPSLSTGLQVGSQLKVERFKSTTLSKPM